MLISCRSYTPQSYISGTPIRIIKVVASAINSVVREIVTARNGVVAHMRRDAEKWNNSYNRIMLKGVMKGEKRFLKVGQLYIYKCAFFLALDLS